MSRPRLQLDLRHGSLLPIALIVLAAVLPYLQTLHYPFMLDDPASIAENPVIQDLGRFLSGAGFRYNPRRFIGYLTLALNYRLGGLDTFGYHAVNIAVHAAAAVLVYTLVRLTFRSPLLRESSLAPRGPFIALATALLFAVHPIQTQAVTYIVQRFASLAALFYLLAMVLYVGGRLLWENGSRQIDDRGRRIDAYEEGADQAEVVAKGPASRLAPILLFAGAGLAAVLAVMTKESAVTLPLMLLLYELSFFRPSRRRRLLLTAGLIVVVALPLVLLASADRPLDEIIGDIDRHLRERGDISRWAYLTTQFRVIVTYLRLLVLPIGQNLDYEYPVANSVTPEILLSSLFLFGLAALALWLYRGSGFSAAHRERNGGPAAADEADGSAACRPLSSFLRFSDPAGRLIGFGILWFFLALAVTSSLIPISDVLVEHRLYLPSVGFALALVTAAALLGRRLSPSKLVALLAVVVIALGLATVRRNLVWSDPVTLWTDVTRKSPLNERAWCNLGVAQLERGDVEPAIHNLLLSARINPAYAKTQLNLGVAFGFKQRLPEAAQALEAALAINPKLWLAHANLGTIYWRMGRLDLAIEHLQGALKLNPRDSVARAQLDKLLQFRNGR